MKHLSTLFSILGASLLCLFLVSGAASADPGSNYAFASQSAWVSAGNADFNTGAHLIITYFDPTTDYWKAEVRTRCLNAEYYHEWARELVYTEIEKYPYTDRWQAFSDSQDSWDDGPGPIDHDYPGGAGVPGFHTPNYGNFFEFTLTTPDWAKFASTRQCEFRVVFYNHV